MSWRYVVCVCVCVLESVWLLININEKYGSLKKIICCVNMAWIIKIVFVCEMRRITACAWWCWSAPKNVDEDVVVVMVIRLKGPSTQRWSKFDDGTLRRVFSMIQTELKPFIKLNEFRITCKIGHEFRCMVFFFFIFCCCCYYPTYFTLYTKGKATYYTVWYNDISIRTWIGMSNEHPYKCSEPH